MKKLLVGFIFFLSLLLLSARGVTAQTTPAPNSNTPEFIIACGCPTELSSIYSERGEKCVGDYETFKQNPAKNHFWVEDPQITAQGKADERARQFIYWVINTPSKDDNATNISIWGFTRNISYAIVVLVAAVMGIGIMISQRVNFGNKLQVSPYLWKLFLMFLYITFSASLIILVIQGSELLMKFFIENLGGNKLFNIDFGVVSGEGSYTGFVGCRDLNIRVQEGVHAELMMLKLTNVAYYIMGTMLLLRKILLWFLLIVSPFLAILMPFVFIRNTGWIWIGVFFQWIFYGPLFALFLGALAKIWAEGIPFLFNFSRTGRLLESGSYFCDPAGYIYPTAINILYGGPAQTATQNAPLSICNNGNYVDTYVEYIITLIMLMAVTFFPWWLLRIFRDYCCDGIYAVKNILMSMYDQSRGGPGTPPSPGPTFRPSTTGTALKIPREIEVPVKVKLETMEDVKKTRTEEISRSLNLEAHKLTDIARIESTKKSEENTIRNISYLKNPVQADTPRERQKYMNIRTELFSRAVKDDQTAKRILSSLSSSPVEQREQQEALLKTIPERTPITKVVSIKVRMPVEKVESVTSSVLQSASTSQTLIKEIAQSVQVPETQVQTTLTVLKEHLNEAPATLIETVSKEANVSKETVSKVLTTLNTSLTHDKLVTEEVAKKENVNQEEVKKVISNQIPLIADPVKNVEETVSIPPTVSLDEYEEVKRMWKEQYEKGEVPVADNIKSREQWVDTDVVFITNTLNKILSTDETIRRQGLEDVGYILPIFLINNIKGDELVVYLKAKLEAAKTVRAEKEKETELSNRLKQKSEEELVNVPAAKKTDQEKTMEMKQELQQEVPTTPPTTTPSEKE